MCLTSCASCIGTSLASSKSILLPTITISMFSSPDWKGEIRQRETDREIHVDIQQWDMEDKGMTEEYNKTRK